MKMPRLLSGLVFVWAVAQAIGAQPIQGSAGVLVRDGWVTVRPPEFQGAINNPLKGFRDYKAGGYGC